MITINCRKYHNVKSYLLKELAMIKKEVIKTKDISTHKPVTTEPYLTIDPKESDYELFNKVIQNSSIEESIAKLQQVVGKIFAASLYQEYTCTEEEVQEFIGNNDKESILNCIGEFKDLVSEFYHNTCGHS